MTQAARDPRPAPVRPPAGPASDPEPDGRGGQPDDASYEHPDPNPPKAVAPVRQDVPTQAGLHQGDPTGTGSPADGIDVVPPRAEPAQPVPGAPPPIRREDTGPIGLRQRLARLGRSQPQVSPVLEPLFRIVWANDSRSDFTTLVRAFEMAQEAHRGQRRRSGEPYISHPVAVAQILAELGLGVPLLAAALLHDTVEDSQVTLDTVRREFGDQIADLVDGVTKLDKVVYGDAAQAETVRKMIVAMSKDIGVLFIKLADRLHNARTWKYMPPEKAARKARETLEIYAPLAHRLGMNAIKWELEDLSFSALYPGVYEELVQMVRERAPARKDYLTKVRTQLTEELRNARIKATVESRDKHYYSIYQKMIVRGRELADIYDLVALRVLVEDVGACYAALGTVHSLWNPVPNRFKDYIAMPKMNMYQSLHTTVIGPGGQPVEVQIRTHLMHRRAELGVAAHWKYKDDQRKGRSTASGDMPWLRQIVDWQNETQDPQEFLEALRFEVGAGELYVFTPKGDVVALPVGSTPVDFAYAVHTEVGHRTMGARVNGRLVALDSVLDNGDAVEIFTSKVADAGPSRDWLNFVKSPRARTKIKHWFSKERREESIDQGKQALAKALRKQRLPIQRLLSQESLQAIAAELRYVDISALYAAIGDGHVSAESVVKRMVAALGDVDTNEEDLAERTIPGHQPRSRSTTTGVIVEGMDDVWTKLARCCTPVPGDEIVGFVTRGHGVSVHRASCVNVAELRKNHAHSVGVSWEPGVSATFLVQIRVEAVDRSRLLSDITRVLADNHVDIISAESTTSRDRVAILRFAFEMGGVQHLGHVLNAVKRVSGVYNAYRIGSDQT